MTEVAWNQCAIVLAGLSVLVSILALNLQWSRWRAHDMDIGQLKKQGSDLRIEVDGIRHHIEEPTEEDGEIVWMPSERWKDEVRKDIREKQRRPEQ